MRDAPGVTLAVLSLVAACSSSSAVTETFVDAGIESSVGDSDAKAVEVGDAPTQGPASARVVVVEFGDFECPYCGAEETVVTQMLSDYAGRIRFAFKEFPLASIHPYAELAAEAALAANAQGKFWPYHDALYANQSAIQRSDLDDYASMVGLDQKKFDAALDDGTFKAAVAADVAQGTALGVAGTPTFFVNGIAVVGAVPYADLQSVIDAQLAR
jgi:protein-disulfide isomerase